MTGTRCRTHSPLEKRTFVNGCSWEGRVRVGRRHHHELPLLADNGPLFRRLHAAPPLFLFACRSRRRIPPPEQIIEKCPRHHRQLPACRIDGVPVAQDGEAFDVEHGELAGLVEREGVAGEGRDAEADRKSVV